MKELSLNTLAVEINDFFNMSIRHKDQALIYAAKCGEKLVEAKASCNHGEWGQWLEDNCKVKKSQAHSFMRLANEKPELLDSNFQHAGDMLSIRATMALLDASEEAKDEAIQLQENGENLTEKRIKELEAKHKKEKRLIDQLQSKLEEKESQVQNLDSQLEDTKSKLNLADSNNQRLQKNIGAEVDKALKIELATYESKLQELQKERDGINKKLAAQRKHQAQMIADGVKSKLKEQQSEINSKEGQLQSLEGRISALKKTRQRLEEQVGEIQGHNEAIEKCQLACEQIVIDWHNVAMEGPAPAECIEGWEKTANMLEEAVRGIRQYTGNECEIIEFPPDTPEAV